MEKIAYFSTRWSGCWLLLKYVSDWDGFAGFAESRMFGVRSFVNGLRSIKSFKEGFRTLISLLGTLILSFDETEMIFGLL